jgi:hypothetical protein
LRSKDWIDVIAMGADGKTSSQRRSGFETSMIARQN